MSANSQAKLSAPINFPGYTWEPMTASFPIPENATYYPEEHLHGDGVRIGRVHDGNCIYIGTVIPRKKICIYLSKNLEMKSSCEYEIISVDHYPRINFRDIDSEDSKLEFEKEIPIHYDWEFPPDMTYWSIMVPAGVDEAGRTLGVASYVENENTYYGWVNPFTKKAYIPRNASEGPQVLDKNFSVMLRGGIPRMMLFKC